MKENRKNKENVPRFPISLMGRYVGGYVVRNRKLATDGVTETENGV